MDLDIVFLGTAGSMPTAQRAPAALLLRRGGDRLLFDCAEGTQRQLLRSSVGLVDLPEIFLTHFHADHVLGLPGMLKTFSLRGRELPMDVYGPRGLGDLMSSLKRVVGKLSYELRLIELEPGDVLERDGFRLAAFAVAHGVTALGWSLIEATRPGRFDVAVADALGVPNGPERGRLQHGEAVTLADGTTIAPEQVVGPPRPGRKLAITGDTAPSETIVEAAWGAEVLITEATFSEEEAERAREEPEAGVHLAGVAVSAVDRIERAYPRDVREREDRRGEERAIVQRAPRGPVERAVEEPLLGRLVGPEDPGGEERVGLQVRRPEHEASVELHVRGFRRHRV